MFKNNIRHHFRDIDRGCSFCIPIAVRDDEDKGINLTEYEANFTMKRTPFDFDRYDEKALINKTILLNDATNGEFKVLLSSEELDLPPGPYFFDLILVHTTTKESVRILSCDFNLIGGPGNRQVSAQTGSALVTNPGVIINLIPEAPVIVHAPFYNDTILNDLTQRVKALEDKVNSLSTVKSVKRR